MRKLAKKLTVKNFLILSLAFFILSSAAATAYGFDDDWSAESYDASLIDSKIETSNSLSKMENFKSFYSILNRRLIKRGWKKEDLCDEKDLVVNRIMREYGSIFVVADAAVPPPVCMFTSAEAVENFQNEIKITGADIAGTRIELQSAAMKALLEARAEALQKNLNITPRDGAEAGRRNYDDTVRLWKSRFEPACEYWKKQGRLTAAQIEKLKSLPVKEQVKEVLILEEQKIYFNKFFNNSILYSVAAPGTSQHLSMLALDIDEFNQPAVREIMAKHGWFQTVKNDVPHFTFLGHRQADLKSLGLKEATTASGKFWIPNA